MTCLIAIPVAGRVVLACDTLILEGDIRHPPASKMREVAPGMWLAWCGELGAGQHAARALQAVDEELSWGDLDRIAGLLREEVGQGSSFLLVAEGGIAAIDADGAVCVYEEPIALGSGALFALGFMAAHEPCATVSEARALALDALEACAQLQASVGAPFLVEVV